MSAFSDQDINFVPFSIRLFPDTYKLNRAERRAFAKRVNNPNFGFPGY